MDAPNVTDKKYPGNPTKSYRSREPLRVVSEYLDWQGHSPEEIRAMKDFIVGKEPIDLVIPSVPLSQEIANRTGVNSITLVQYGGDVTAFFVDGRTWWGSNLPVGRGMKLSRRL